jgi:predicted small secreted protein
MRKIFLFIFAFVFVSLFAGCETTKNTVYGIHRIAAGVADDVYNTGRNLQKADNWVQENAW